MVNAESDGHAQLIELYQVMPDAPLPTPAGESMVRSLPSKALRFCPPVIAATTLGWCVYPPMDFALRFDGQQTDWRDADGVWHRVTPGEEAHVPAWTEQYEQQFPPSILAELADDVPGLYNADPNAPNRVEMYSGVMVRTAPEWSLLVRSPANMPMRTDHFLYEGIIETGWWVAMLPTIVELTTPGLEVEFRRHRPLAQLQLVPAGQVAMQDAGVIGGIKDVPAAMWDTYLDTRMRRTREDRLGSYQRLSRQLRREQVGEQGDETASDADAD